MSSWRGAADAPPVRKEKLVSVSLTKVKLVQYPSVSSPNSVVQLPQHLDLERLKEDFRGSEVLGVVPYAEPDNWELNATAVTMIRNALRGFRVVAHIPANSLKEAKHYIQVYQAAGLDAFALPELIGGTPVQHKAGFWMMGGLLHPRHWYHLAGGRGVDIPADVPGLWTWSEEGL